ncbi:MAG: altronate dehydratase family protein [Elusimicrobiota bacterium]|jgi:altronate hydrolase|nr:altronate dehydratase family protein [Elusimicrobiota bacterium]
MSEKNKFVIINSADNVAVALSDLSAGETVDGFVLLDKIPFGHKFSIKEIKNGENIIKYGYPIGHATQDIKKGVHIHTHNLKTNLDGILEYSYHGPQQKKPIVNSFKNAVFQGYKRKSGGVGVRNEIWIIPTVGCVGTTAKILERKANELFKNRTDGIFAFPHNMGCSQLGDDHLTTQNILKGLINNPNAGGVLVLSLGCENNNLESFKPVLGQYDSDRVKFLVAQNSDNEIEAGLKIIEELVNYTSSFKRETLPASKLIVGFKCGGSDAFSGITANPLCGIINDILTDIGGSTILTEVPEMFGAETLLMERAASKEVFDKTIDLINNFKKYFKKYNQVIYENPSPGNKKGGVSSLEEKSLGCTQKSGLSLVVDVLDYGQNVKIHGLNLLAGPGNDQVSTTNLTASGAQIILFTTGRGNPFGAPVPTIKISSNTNLFNYKNNWIDFDAGVILKGIPVDEIAKEFFYFILDTASGRIQTKNEINGYREISIFKNGVIL